MKFKMVSNMAFGFANAGKTCSICGRALDADGKCPECRPVRDR